MNLTFWKAAAERAVKTFAQAALALLGTGSVGITSLDWRVIGSVAATAAVASLLTSLASLSNIVPGAPVSGAPAPANDTRAVPQPATVTLDVPAPATVFPAAKVEAAQAATEPAPVVPVLETPATPVA